MIELCQQLTWTHYPTTDYQDFFNQMKSFTLSRGPHDNDQVWSTQHLPVFTLGRHSLPEHILIRNQIPVVQTDRGGQVTYHGPGQLMIYPLINLKNRHIGVAEWVCLMETSLIQLLKHYDINAHREPGRPGIYVNHQKIASIGLRIKKGCSYHGIALNIAMDLGPFKQINPCGYDDLTMCQLADFIPGIQVQTVLDDYQSIFKNMF